MQNDRRPSQHFQASVTGGDCFLSSPLRRLLLPCGDGGTKDRATLWAESDSCTVRSSEPGCCTPQGRTGHHDNEPSQRGWTHIREDTNHNYTRHTVGGLLQAAGTKTQKLVRTFLSQEQRGGTVQRLWEQLLMFSHTHTPTPTHASLVW